MHNLERSDQQEWQPLVSLSSAASADDKLTSLEKEIEHIVPGMFSRFSQGKLETLSHVVGRLVAVDPTTDNAHLINKLVKKCFKFTEKYQKEKGIDALNIRLTAYKISVLNHLITQTQEALDKSLDKGSQKIINPKEHPEEKKAELLKDRITLCQKELSKNGLSLKVINEFSRIVEKFTSKSHQEKDVSELSCFALLKEMKNQYNAKMQKLAIVKGSVPVDVLKEKLHLVKIEQVLTKWKFTKLAIESGSSPQAIAAVIRDKSDPLGEIRAKLHLELCFHMPIVNKFIQLLYFHGVIYSKDFEIKRSMIETPDSVNLLNLRLRNVCVLIDNTGLKKKLIELGLADRLKQAGVSADIQKELLKNPGTRDGFRSWFSDTFFYLPPSTEEYMSHYIRIAKLHSDLTLVLNADAESAKYKKNN